MTCTENFHVTTLYTDRYHIFAVTQKLVMKFESDRWGLKLSYNECKIISYK